ncbi:MAG: hydroxyacylglutathione hydrolase [Proteobacteria bacterium]|nr:hydroxyacylglutathione hydrolase [Pseudomonadota bacterium]
MEIAQFRYMADNLAYVLHGPSQALVVDGGAVEDIREYIAARGLTPVLVTNTHRHPDHTAGTRELVAALGCPYADPDDALAQGEILLNNEAVRAISTPGHTMDSLCFLAPGFAVTGDTLFNATVGNCFTGDVEAFFRSLKTIMAWPPETFIYSGHDYVDQSLAFAWHLEPDNPAITAYEAKYDPALVRSTLADEFSVNPYLRFNAPPMIRLLKDRNLPVETEFERFSSVMRLG